MQGYLKRSTIMKFSIMVMVTVSSNNNNYKNNHSNINSVWGGLNLVIRIMIVM